MEIFRTAFLNLEDFILCMSSSESLTESEKECPAGDCFTFFLSVFLNCKQFR